MASLGLIILIINHRFEANIDLFIALLVLLGCGLTLFPEFFYLRDQFATRMNTIFKFYFQAWITWGIAAGLCDGPIMATEVANN